MFRYKLEEYVHVKPNAYKIKSPALLLFTDNMKQYCGNIYKIKAMLPTLNDHRCYTLEGCETSKGNPYYFDECWLEPTITIYDTSNDFIRNIEETVKEDDIMKILGS